MSKQGAHAQQVKRKQLLIAGLAGAIVLVLAGGAAVFVSNSGPGIPTGQPTATQLDVKPMVTGANAFNDKEAYRQKVESDLAGMRAEWKEFKERDELSVRTKQMEEAQRRLQPGYEGKQPPAPTGTDNGSVFAPPAPPPPPTPAQPEVRRAAKNGIQPPNNPNGGLFNGANGAPVPPPGGANGDGSRSSGIGHVKFEDDSSQAPGGRATTGQQGSLSGGPAGTGPAVGSTNLGGGIGAAPGASGEESGGTGERKQAGSYIPAGTFVRMVVLNGLDAPTGGQAQSNPAPVLLKIIDSATMPNGYKANLSGCIITANGYGDVSAERAYIRLDRLTCISDDGGAIDIGVKGYVAGEDGKSGMRGRLVSKTGQILANGLLAAVGSGIGKAFSSGASTTTTNPFGGQTSTTNPGKEFQAGIGTGIGTAFEGLSKYYIALAEKTFPIIEIDGARVSDVVFSRGFTLEGR